jgi:hypothetical protein
MITWCFSCWPSYRSEVCCIGLRRNFTESNKQQNILIGHIKESNIVKNDSKTFFGSPSYWLVNCVLSLSRVYINQASASILGIVLSKINFNKCTLYINRVCQLSVWSVSLHFELQQTTDISRGFSLRMLKRLADSDLAVIGLTGIGPIWKISVLDWFLSYWLNESLYIVLTDLII